ncbi:hypothetical protein GXW82_37390 [Streptacidiphilus sp. 4-A2]|nr:hypothetical protein [Streptacidiphilus sp. 4-A2]
MARPLRRRGLIGGDQATMTGGRVTGDVFSAARPRCTTTPSTRRPGPARDGEVPGDYIDRLMECFRPGEHFAAAESHLRESRLVLLRGGRHSGRRAASLALLRTLGVGSPRVLDPTVGLDDLLEQTEPAPGYVLWDPRPNLGREQLEARLLTLRGRLARDGGYLVITTETETGLSWTVDWAPPPQAELLTAHLRAALLRADQAALDRTAPGQAAPGLPTADQPGTDRTGPDHARAADQAGPGPGLARAGLVLAAGALLALPATVSFLDIPRTPREVAAYAQLLCRHALGEVTEEDLLRSDRAAVEEQVTSWFAEGGPDLREQSFLISLAVFDEAAYALAAEYGDVLHGLLHALEEPEHPAGTKVFGTSVKQRLAAARATLATVTETVAWGVQRRRTAAFDDPRTRSMLLGRVWLDHPSARPALLDWIHRLAADEDPAVRAHAAAATAVLAEADLPSVMPRLLEPWAASLQYRLRNQAVNSLALLALDTDSVFVPQILHEWCESPDDEIRWTGIRGHGLIGALFPEEALRDIGDLVARTVEEPALAGLQPEAEQQAAITSTCLLLLTTSRSQVLTRLASWLQPPGPRSVLAVSAFLAACYAPRATCPIRATGPHCCAGTPSAARPPRAVRRR